jgi:NAD(P)-dependent dehydrogenase (short-subunit alcohol dehydrogenase family)
MQRLSGKIAFVTGGARGIGRAIVEKFIAEGAFVAFVDVDDSVGRDAAHELGEVRGTCEFHRADVTAETEVRDVIDSVVRRHKTIDILVNNAGINAYFDATRMTEAEWDRVFAVDLKGAWLCAKYALRAMVEAGRGSIVNIASMAGRRGLMYRVGYCSAKAGQIGMTYGLALELGKHNITVNAIAPGAVAGDRIDRVIQGQADVRGVDVERMRKSFVERSPLQRMSTAEDIASLAAFLCSEGARNISGQCIPVTAGEPAS